MTQIKSDTAGEVIRPIIEGKALYCRVPIARKIVGSGARDTNILLNGGVPMSMCDLAIHVPTGTYYLDNSLVRHEDYSPSLSTTRLLQLLPRTFVHNGRKLGVMLIPVEAESFGLNSLSGVIVDVVSGEEFEEFRGHPVSVLVQLIKFTSKTEK